MPEKQPFTERDWYEDLLKLWDSFEADWEPRAIMLYNDIAKRTIDNFNPQQTQQQQAETIERNSVDIDAISVLLGAMFFAMFRPTARFQSSKRKEPMPDYSDDQIRALSEEAIQEKPRRIKDHIDERLKLVAVGEVDKAEVERKAKRYAKTSAKQFNRTNVTAFGNMVLIKNMEHMYPTKIIQKRWLSMRDNRVRPAHLEADKRYSKSGAGLYLYDYFEVDNEFLPFPAGGLKRSNNINCRCSIIFDVY